MKRTRQKKRKALSKPQRLQTILHKKRQEAVVQGRQVRKLPGRLVGSIVLLVVLFGSVMGIWIHEIQSRSVAVAKVVHRDPMLSPEEKGAQLGEVIDHFTGVPVYYNSRPYNRSHGRHFSKGSSPYYYGQKWQCVEFIKRYYFDALGHRMPETMGHAKSFFDNQIPHGALNRKRGLVQYRNGGDRAPQVHDLLVFTDQRYGHVAIVSKVGKDYIEVIHQNMIRDSRAMLRLTRINRDGKWHYLLSGGRQPAGWLRLP